ncbi:MAG: DUF1553 domain-containing protein [Acidobacteria bacterium]|nr:DUF1553 domain-containing protein [Acidobacteriota bacterium]
MIRKRAFRLPMLEVFDAPEPMLTCSRRDSSTTAPQSLTLLNGTLVIDQARAAGERLAAAHADDTELLRAAFRQVLSRDPSAPEEDTSLAFLARQRENTGTRAGAATELIRGLLNLNEFLYVD